jgi:hypothetical protein
MSTYSNASELSVSYYGEELPLEQALDSSFKALQENLNNCHCTTREVVMGADRNEDFETMLQLRFDIEDYTDEMAKHFKELNGIMKQIISPVGKVEKELYKSNVLKRKEMKKENKLEAITE